MWRGQDAYTFKPFMADPLMFGTCPTELQGVFFLEATQCQLDTLNQVSEIVNQ